LPGRVAQVGNGPGQAQKTFGVWIMTTVPRREIYDPIYFRAARWFV